MRYTSILAATLSCFLLVSCAGNSLKSEHATQEERVGSAYLSAGTQFLYEGNATEALRALLDAAKHMPNSPDVWNNLGLAYHAKNEKNKARESWERAIQIDKNFSDARNNLGAHYLEQGMLSKAEEEFKKVLKDLVYDKIYQTEYNLGLVYYAQKKYLLAEQHIKLSLQQNETYCPAWIRLALLEKDRGSHAQAIEAFHKATTGQCFKNPEAHYKMAESYLQNNDSVHAKSKFIEIIELFPQSEWAKRAESKLNIINQN